jgi:hypothetical protein
MRALLATWLISTACLPAPAPTAGPAPGSVPGSLPSSDPDLAQSDRFCFHLNGTEQCASTEEACDQARQMANSGTSCKRSGPPEIERIEIDEKQSVAGIRIFLKNDLLATWNLEISNLSDRQWTILWDESYIEQDGRRLGRLAFSGTTQPAAQMPTQVLRYSSLSTSFVPENFIPEESSIDVRHNYSGARIVLVLLQAPPWGADPGQRYEWIGVARGISATPATSESRYSPSEPTGSPPMAPISPSTPSGGCSTGCPCGNSCIDCAKTCRGGSTYRKRRRR